MHNHRQLISTAVEMAVGKGATYAEARIVQQNRQLLVLINGEAETVCCIQSVGLGLRILVDGAWGFGATAETDAPALSRLVGSAVALAKASASCRRNPVVLASCAPVVAEVREIGRVDPLAIPFTDRLALLRETHTAMTGVDDIVRTRLQMDIRREWVTLMTSEGTYISQEIGTVGGGLAATADVRGTKASRSFPHHGGWDCAVGGYEWFEGLHLPVEGRRIAEEAVLLTGAKPCQRTVTTVVVDPTMVGTMVHETVGHPTELDRSLGDELDNFGTSFLSPDRLDSFPYGSPVVSLIADATIRGAPASYAFDAEGIPAQRIPLVTKGIFTGFLMSRECAARIGRQSNGTARASSWARIPMPRITNLVLEPGNSSLRGLISEVDEGVYIQTYRTADIDDNRLLCSFSGEIGWEIRHGRLGDPIRSPVVFTSATSLWRNCDGVGGAEESRISAFAECGKGQPWQFVITGQGGPPARFRNIQVGLP